MQMGKVVNLHATLRKALIRSYIYRKIGHLACVDGPWAKVRECPYYTEAAVKASDLLNDIGDSFEPDDPDDGERMPVAA